MARRTCALDVPFHAGSGSWLNAAESFFSVTRRAIRRGVFKSVANLRKAIRDYI
jgi:hypothetical protein